MRGRYFFKKPLEDVLFIPADSVCQFVDGISDSQMLLFLPVNDNACLCDDCSHHMFLEGN